VVSVKDSLAKNKCDNTGRSPPFSYLVPADYYPFPRLKSALTGRSFGDITEIIKNATEELKMLSQNGFQKRFQHLYSF
jgi:hypothetical protein